MHGRFDVNTIIVKNFKYLLMFKKNFKKPINYIICIIDIICLQNALTYIEAMRRISKT